MKLEPCEAKVSSTVLRGAYASNSVGLLDYASCERVFCPNLKGKPVLVLSNNDGCAIARSTEAKAIGIKMGQPYFEIKDLCKKYGVRVFSSNYTLYASMSKRFQETVKPFGVRQEVYSIDENFLDLTGIPNLTTHGFNIKDRVKKWTGLPVCVGIGQTKVLAKFANHLAKKHKFLNGVCNLEELGEARTNKAMQLTDVSEVWGIGRKLSVRLNQMGIKTVYDLKLANAKQLSKIFNVNVERIVYELNKMPMIEFEDIPPANKQIVSSRSFAKIVNSRDALFSSFTFHAEKISEKLRKQNLYARQIVLFAHSNRFHDNYFSSSELIVFPEAVDSFRFINKYIDKALDKIYKPHIGYKKAGIAVIDIIDNELQLRDLFDRINIKHDKVLPSIEVIKKRFGKDAIYPASATLSDDWKMQRGLMSQRFTTELEEILTII